jgi:hypothetical protein
MTEKQKPFDALAYTTVQAAQVTGRSHTRIKLAIRRKEIVARKDGRATIIERAELTRWIAAMPTIGRPEATESVVADAKARQPERGRVYAPSLKPRPAFDTIESKQPRR